MDRGRRRKATALHKAKAHSDKCVFLGGASRLQEKADAMKGDDKKPLMKRKRKVALASEIYELMLDGESDTDIIEQLDLTAQDFFIARKFLLVERGKLESGMSSEERFARYQIAQEQNVSDLTDLIKNLNNKSQFNALVGALRLRTEILHKSIEMGQTLGVIDRQADRKELLIAGVAISDLPDKDLKKGVVEAFAGLRVMMDRYGDGQKLMELVPGELHHGEAVPALVESTAAVSGAPEMKEPAKGKRNKANTGKRHAGRRRVKG